MMVIHNNPGISQVELEPRDRARQVVGDAADPGSASGTISSRASSPKTDRRSVTLTLTRAGETMLRRLLVHAVDHDRKLDAIVGERKARADPPFEEDRRRSRLSVGRRRFCSMYTASMAMLEALSEAGVSYAFANFGSDHPALIEAIAEARATGRKIPKIVTCPNEMVALSAAHGFAQVSGRAQAVIVHVDCGTQALAGAVHNAARGRVPVFIYAGLSPSTQEGELKGSRNEFIHWLQDTHDQRGIMRQYVKYENEFRTGANVKQIVHRAMQLARERPEGAGLSRRRRAR